MKFRGKIVDTSNIQGFANIFYTVAKVSKFVAVRITTTHLYFIMSSKLTAGGTGLWCALDQQQFFDEYNMEGVSKESNEIYLEMSSENFQKTLKSANVAKSLKIKLTRKHSPCLTLEIELPSLADVNRLVTHDVPVTVVSRRLWDEYQEPTMPQFHLSVFLPHPKTLGNVLERMKNLGTHVVLVATREGAISLRIETNKVQVTTHFGELEIAAAGVNEEELEQAEVRVDIRKLYQLFSGIKLNPSRIICNIVNEKMLHLFLLRDDTTIQYFLPSVGS